MKFGAVANQSGVTWQELVDFWKDLDGGSAFDSLWLMDHFVSGFGQEFGSEGPCMEGWTALAALAQATSRVRLGILVTGNTYRHPAVLAKQATTVDHISGGRLIFGLGAGWHEYEHRAFGINLPPVKERLDRLEEAAHIIKALWTEERPSWTGEYYSLDRPPYNPPNVQSSGGGHPPILIGGGGEKRTLRITARYANEWNVWGTPAILRQKMAVLDQHCLELGRNPRDIQRSAVALLFLSDDQAVIERARGAGRPVIAGNAAEVRATIQDYIDAGVDEVIIPDFTLGPGLENKKGAMDRFMNEVASAFR